MSAERPAELSEAERSWAASKRARRRAQPPFFTAVAADARITSFYRGETTPSGGLRTLLAVLRLAWVSDAFLAQTLYRFGARMTGLGVPVLPRIVQGLTMVLAQMSIDGSVIVRPGVSFAHGHVVIGGLTEIRAGTLVAPFVSIGLVAGDVRGPLIGQRSVIGTGARILGPVNVGARARIGANAVVLQDVPEDGVAVGVPARIVEP